MANELGIPLRPQLEEAVRSSMHVSLDDNQDGVFEQEAFHIHDERVRERCLKMRARRAAHGVVGLMRACGSRIAFRCRNRAAYPRRCVAPRAVFITTPQKPLSDMSLAQLDALRANLEAEELGLMEKLQELWQHLSIGAHLQPAFVDPDRLAHVTRLLLSGDTRSVELDPDNDEVSGAATMQLTSQRLEAALLDVHEQIQAVAEERRRRKGLQPTAGSVASEPTARRPPSPTSPRRGKSHAAGAGTCTKRALSFAGFAAGKAAASVTPATTAGGATHAGTAARRSGSSAGRVDETPKRKLSLLSLSQSLLEDADEAGRPQSRDAAEGVGSPRRPPKALVRLHARLSRRTGSGGGAAAQVPCSWPARDGDEGQGLVELQELGYTQLPTQE